MSLADVVILVLMALASVVGAVSWSGLFRDWASLSGWDLQKQRDAEVARAVGESLSKQVSLLESKERVVAEVVESARADALSEQRAQEIERALERIDSIDRAAEEIRARVKARQEQIERDFAELVKRRRLSARIAVVWRCAALVCGVAGAVLLGLWLF